MTKNDREWWEAEVAMHRDRAQRLEADVVKRQEDVHFYRALANLLGAVVLRAGAKPLGKEEKAAIEWAEQNPDAQAQIRMAA